MLKAWRLHCSNPLKIKKMNTLNQIPNISQQKSLKVTKDNKYWKRARFRRAYSLIDSLNSFVISSTKERAGDPYLINALLVFMNIGIAHKKIVISRKNLAEKLGCCIWKAGDLIDDLYKIGIIYKVAQRYKNSKPTTNSYYLMKIVKDAEFIELVFWLAKAYKKLTFSLMLMLKKALKEATTSLLSSSPVIYNSSLNINPSLQQQNHTLRLETEERIPKKGKAGPMEQPYIIDYDKKEIIGSANSTLSPDQILDLERKFGYKWVDKADKDISRTNFIDSLRAQCPWPGARFQESPTTEDDGKDR